MPRPLLLTSVLTVTLGFAGGWIVGRGNRTRAPQESIHDTQAATEPQSAKTTLPAFAAADSAGSDLAEQLRAALKLPQNQRRWRLLNRIALGLDVRQTPTHLDIARQVLPRDQYYNFRWMLVERWAESEPATVLAWAQNLTRPDERNGAIYMALTELARKDPDAAMAWMDKVTSGTKREMWLPALIAGMGEADIERAMALMEKLPKHQQAGVRHAIIESLAERDPQAAAEMALKHDKSRRWGSWDAALGPALTKWMDRDPDAALGWLKSQPESVLRKKSVTDSIANLSWQNPKAAVQLLGQLPGGRRRDDSLAQTLNNLGRQDPEALQ